MLHIKSLLSREQVAFLPLATKAALSDVQVSLFRRFGVLFLKLFIRSVQAAFQGVDMDQVSVSHPHATFLVKYQRLRVEFMASRTSRTSVGTRTGRGCNRKDPWRSGRCVKGRKRRRR